MVSCSSVACDRSWGSRLRLSRLRKARFAVGSKRKNRADEAATCNAPRESSKLMVGLKCSPALSIEHDGGSIVHVLRLPKMVDEWPRQCDGLPVARQLLVHQAFKIGFRNKGVLLIGGRKKTVLHFIETNISARVAVLQDRALIANQFLRQLL